MTNATQSPLRTKLLPFLSGTSIAKGESGQSLIETAICLTFATVLILGAGEFGRLAYASIEVANAASSGAQYGAQSHTTASDTANIQIAAEDEAPDVSGLTATASYSCLCSNGSASTCLATDCSTSRIIESVTVHTTATVNPLIYVPGLPKSYVVHGTAVFRVEQ